MTFTRGQLVRIKADVSHLGHDDTPYYGFVDGWFGRVGGTNAGLFEVHCAEGGEMPGNTPVFALPMTLLVPASELTVVHA